MANPGVTIIRGQARRAPRPAGQTLIGLVGTAPQAASAQGLNSITLVNNVGSEVANNTLFGTEGTIPAQLAAIDQNVNTGVIVVRVADDTPDFQSPTPAQVVEGIKQLETANDTVGAEPHLIGAPGFTFNRGADPYPPLDTQSSVMTQLQVSATALDAIAIGLPAPTSVALAKTWADNNRQGRVFACFPRVVDTAGRTIDPFGFVAGALARGNVWDNPMFTDLRGIVRTEIPIGYHLRNTSDDAHSLQADNITAIIAHNGYHLFGATLLVPDTNTEPDRFLNVLREIDDLDIQLDVYTEGALRLNLVAGFADYVISHLQQYIDSRTAIGALNAGEVSLDDDANTESELDQGRVHFRIDVTPAFPAQHIIYTRTLSNQGIVI